jgi:uncharacterized membrane protein
MKQICIVLMILVIAGCSANRPVLYPNDQFQQDGREQANIAIDQCKSLADQAGISDIQYKSKRTATNGAKGAVLGAVSGAIGGAISGGVGIGTVIGAASGAAVGIISSLMTDNNTSPSYQQFINRCLQDQGYEVIGWE